MFFNLKMPLALVRPLFSKINLVALICLLIFVNAGSTGKLPIKSDNNYSSGTSVGLSAPHNSIIEINLGLKKHQTAKVSIQSNVVISCNIIHLQGWYKNNENMNVEMKYLTFKSIKKIDSGIYGCKATNNVWSNVTLSVISLKHNNKTAEGGTGSSNSGESSKKLHFVNTSAMHSLLKKNVGESVQFNCDVDDPAKTLNSKLTWTKNGKPLNRSAPLYFTKTSLQIEDLRTDDAGQYTCHICNGNSCINFTTILNVLETGDDTKMDRYIDNLVADADGLNNDKNDNERVTNYDEDENLYLEPEFREHKNKNLAKRNNYLSEKQKVVANHTADSNTDSFLGGHEQDDDNQNNKTDDGDHDTINDDEEKGIKPYFSKPQSMVPLIAKTSGNMVRLSCNVKGHPEPTITWTKDDREIQRLMDAVKYRKFALILEDLVPSDTGYYKCRACNEHGCIEHQTKVYVNERFPARPYVKEGFPKNLTVLLNDTAVFECPVVSELAPYSYIEWAKFRAQNNNDTNVGVNVQKFKTDSENPEILRLDNVTFDDEGWYTCYAANSLGTSAASAYLHVVAELPMDPMKLTIREHTNKMNVAEPHYYLSKTQKVVANHTADSNTDSLLGGHEEIDDNQNNKTDDGDHNSINGDKEKGIKPYFSKPQSMEPVIAKTSGNMVRLSCKVKGHPEPTITWTKDDREIQRLMGAVKYRKFALILEDLVPSDTGYYKCRACNEHGCIEHRTKVYDNDRFPARPYVKDGFPKNVTILLNDTAVFECPVVSELAPYIEWAKFRVQNNNDTNVGVNVQKFKTDSENPEILRLDNVTFDDEGWYTCYAANSLGTSAASAYLQVVAELPMDPMKLTIREHTNKMNVAEPHYYLSKTQKVVANHTADSNTDSLLGGHEEIDDNQNNKTDDGDHNSINGDKEKGIKPYFSKPQSMEPLIAKTSGNMVRLSCKVKGHPEPTITWTKDDREIQRLMSVVKYRKFALILEDLVPSDTGYYKCRACNEYGCIEHQTKVYVNDRFPARPYVKEGFPKNVTILLNDTAVFECPVVSELAPYIEWAKFRAQNTNDTNVGVNVQKFKTDSENPEILRLDNVTFDDEGWYTCYAANSLGTSAASAYLQVVAELPMDPMKLTIREHTNKMNVAEPHYYLSKTQKVVANHTADSNTDSLLGGHEEIDDNQNNKTDDGDHNSINGDKEKGIKPYFSKPQSMEPVIAKTSGNMVRLSCKVKGHPEPTITWTKDDREIQRLMSVVKYRKFALILEDLVPSDTGYYKCRACNEYGCIEHQTKVYVNDRFPARPYVKEGFPKNVTILLNDTAVFECPVVSELAPYIEWAKFRAQNNNDTNVGVNVQKFKTDSENPEILRLDNVTFDDEGWYTCYAANSLGTSAASAYLQVVAELF